MNEFARFIEPAEFEEGLGRRLKIGSVAVGDTCKIRFEDIDFRAPSHEIRYAEAVISIIAKSDRDDGFTSLQYIYEALRGDGLVPETDSFDRESIARRVERGLSFRAYLSDDLDSRWDASLEELVDLESHSTIAA